MISKMTHIVTFYHKELLTRTAETYLIEQFSNMLLSVLRSNYYTASAWKGLEIYEDFSNSPQEGFRQGYARES